jgi:cysteine desulfurase
MKNIYLDNAATTQVDKEVIKEMNKYFTSEYGNPSEFHKLGIGAKKALLDARENIAKFLNAKSEEIFFTSSATESINLSHKGLIEAVINEGKIKKPHVITSSIEHKAVLETLNHLKRQNKISISLIPVNKFGRIDLVSFKKLIKGDTTLVSIMYANNEVGTIEPIKEVGEYLKKINKRRKNKIYFHTDSTQAVNYLDCDVNSLNVDLLSFSGHKINAPKGVGVLYIRENTPIVRQIDGGNQEKGLRAGTENVPYIVGVSKAISLNGKEKKRLLQITKLRDRLIKGILKIKGTLLTGDPKERIPSIASFIVKGIEGESMVLLLSQKGIYVSSGSACTSDKLTPSHVLKSMGIDAILSHSSIRFSLGKNTTSSDIDYVLEVFPKIVSNLRKMSPIKI